MAVRRYSSDEKAAALEVIVACAGNISDAARRTQIPERTLNDWWNSTSAASSARARVQAQAAERIDALHATRDEVLSLLAIHLRGDLSALAGCFDATGRLDLEKAKEAGASRLVKKLSHRATPLKRADGTVEYEFSTQIEIHDPQSAAQKLVSVLGLAQQPAENQQDAERRRAFWAAQIERVSQEDGCTPEEARQWLLANVQAAQQEQQWLM